VDSAGAFAAKQRQNVGTTFSKDKPEQIRRTDAQFSNPFAAFSAKRRSIHDDQIRAHVCKKSARPINPHDASNKITGLLQASDNHLSHCL